MRFPRSYTRLVDGLGLSMLRVYLGCYGSLQVKPVYILAFWLSLLISVGYRNSLSFLTFVGTYHVILLAEFGLSDSVLIRFHPRFELFDVQSLNPGEVLSAQHQGG